MATASELREKYLNGELFYVNEIVLDKNEKTIHEVVSLGSNYLTVVDAQGSISKKWLSDVIPADSLKEDFEDLRRKRSSSNQIAFAGYKTKNFNQEIFELFKPLIKEHKKDKFQVLNLVRVTDELLSESKEMTMDNYSKVKSLIERAEKYLAKMNKLHEHSYVGGFVDQLCLFELEEGLKVTSMDRDRAAKIIGDALGVTETGTPEQIVNAAVQKMRAGRFTPEAWKIAGRMFSMATQVGIKWDKNLFPPATRKAMGILD